MTSTGSPFRDRPGSFTITGPTMAISARQTLLMQALVFPVLLLAGTPVPSPDSTKTVKIIHADSFHLAEVG